MVTVAVALTGGLALAGCSSSGGDSGGGGGQSGGDFSIAIESSNTGLLPTNCWDVYCAQVLNAAYTGLYTFEKSDGDAYTATPTELNKSVSSDDAGTSWTISLNEGFDFSNGEKLTAQSFVDTWNYAANGGNGQQLGFVFGPSALNVKGYKAVSGPKTKGEKMAGVSVDENDPMTIKVEVEEPLSNDMFANLLAGPQIMPMSKAALKDPKSQNKQLISNGPFVMQEDATSQSIKLVRNSGYKGTPASADSVEFRIYEDGNSEWADLQGNTLDVVPQLPDSAISSASSVLGERFINQPGAMEYSFYGFFQDSKVFADRDVRVAIAKAIDWDQINSKIWFGTRDRATSFAPATIPGGGTDLCGDDCTFDAAGAKQKLDDAGGLPGGSVEIAALSKGKETTTAVCNQLQTNLGIKCSVKLFSDFGAYIDFLYSDSIPDNFIVNSGWVADNPTIASMIGPFASDSDVNDIGYSNKEFDRLLQEGNHATDPSTQQQKWVDAEKVLFADFYAYPTQMLNTAAGYSTNVSGVEINPLGFVNTADITVNS